MKPNARNIVLPANVRFAFLIGLLLLIEGIWELFSPVVFGVLTSNPLHGLVHLLFAVVAIWAGRGGHARVFLVFFGLFAIALAALWYFPRTNTLMVRLLNMNRPVAYAHGFVEIGRASCRERV